MCAYLAIRHLFTFLAGIMCAGLQSLLECFIVFGMLLRDDWMLQILKMGAGMRTGK